MNAVLISLTLSIVYQIFHIDSEIFDWSYNPKHRGKLRLQNRRPKGNVLPNLRICTPGHVYVSASYCLDASPETLTV